MKGRVRSSPQSAKRGDRSAYPTNHDDTDFGPTRATFLKARLAPCPSASGGRNPHSGPTNGQLGLTCNRGHGGLDQHKRFHRYHRVLSHASWSSREASRILLGLLLEAFVGEGPLILGIDETLERRWGKKISAKGVYRDPVRSTHENFVKSSGLRWVCVMLLVEIPWTTRVWALPFLSALAPSERYAAQRGKRHKKITEWAWQLLLEVRRWYPKREIVAVADSAYASLKLLFRCRSLSRPVTFITRLRLDAALYESRLLHAVVGREEGLASRASACPTFR
ncbi:MAG: transposase [Actinobacteria bacterium]|nr:transposase [Actinomycetota bacterium]